MVRRRSPCHARKTQALGDDLELFRAFNNLVRPHGALRFGKLTRTPAMQAGLAEDWFSFRDVFAARGAMARFATIRFRAVANRESVAGLRWAA